MAKGAESKKIIFDKLLEVFPGAFMADEKTLRIPMTENGDPLEIKVTLTAAKDILGSGASASGGEMNFESSPSPVAAAPTEPTEEEKKNIETLMESLGL